jgi:hypothetical protein
MSLVIVGSSTLNNLAKAEVIRTPFLKRLSGDTWAELFTFPGTLRFWERLESLETNHELRPVS